jgi:3-oxoacyl-[acyl-carrier protein] reductase
MNILVTGCTRGIGLAVTEQLLANGNNVYGVGRSEEKLEQLAAKVTGLSGYFFPIKLDLLSDASYIEETISNKVDFENLDGLVNNFGGTSDNFGSFLSLKISDWNYAFDANVKSSVILSKLYIQNSKDVRNRSIVFLSSVAGVRPGKFNPHYGFMKAGLIHLSKGLANSFGELGFRVNCISPSQLDDDTFRDDITDYSKRVGVTRERAGIFLTEEVMRKRNYKYFGSSRDVADLIIFLLSDRAKLISGQNIVADCAGL